MKYAVAVLFASLAACALPKPSPIGSPNPPTRSNAPKDEVAPHAAEPSTPKRVATADSRPSTSVATPSPNRATAPSRTSSGALLEWWESAAPLARFYPAAPLELPNESRVVDSLSIDDAPLQSIAGAPSWVARVRGLISIDVAGVRAFRLHAPSGARLSIDGHALIDSHEAAPNGVFEAESESLEVGEHALDLGYAAWPSNAKCALEWKAPGASDWAPIPSSALFHASDLSRATSPGQKRVLVPLERAHKSDSNAPNAIHPGYSQRTVELEGVQGIAALDVRPDGRLLLADGRFPGTVWLVDPRSSDATPRAFASGLDHPRGVKCVDDRVFVLQRQELTELFDRDRDDAAEEMRTLSTAWPIDLAAKSGGASMALAGGALWIAASSRDPNANGASSVADSIQLFRIALADGATDALADVLRAPLSLFATKSGWLGAIEGANSRWISPAPRSNAICLYDPRSPKSEHAAQPVELSNGPFAGELVLGADASGRLARVALDRVGDDLQGAWFRFGGSELARAELGASRSDGATWLAGVKHDGTSSLVELTSSSNEFFDVVAVRARSNGFELEFNAPLAPSIGWEAAAFELGEFDPNDATSSRGDGVALVARSSSVSDDRRRVFIETAELHAGRLVKLAIAAPLFDERGRRAWTDEVWYSLVHVPTAALGLVRAAPKEEHNTLASDEERGGWRLLFDGVSTKGWHEYMKSGEPVGWKVVDGTLARVADGGSDLVTDEQFSSFELALDWKIAPGANSGILFHVVDGYDYVWRTGPEMQILDNARHHDGQNPLTSAGSNYALHAPEQDDTFPVGMWNHARILVDGAHVEHWLNGVKQCEYELGGSDWRARVAVSKFAAMPDYAKFDTGRIALQDHGDAVWFRDVKIRSIAR